MWFFLSDSCYTQVQVSWSYLELHGDETLGPPAGVTKVRVVRNAREKKDG